MAVSNANFNDFFFSIFRTVRSKIVLVVCENFLYLSSILNKVSSQQLEQMYCRRISVSEIQFILLCCEAGGSSIQLYLLKTRLILTFFSSFSPPMYLTCNSTSSLQQLHTSYVLIPNVNSERAMIIALHIFLTQQLLHHQLLFLFSIPLVFFPSRYKTQEMERWDHPLKITDFRMVSQILYPEIDSHKSCFPPRTSEYISKETTTGIFLLRSLFLKVSIPGHSV